MIGQLDSGAFQCSFGVVVLLGSLSNCGDRRADTGILACRAEKRSEAYGSGAQMTSPCVAQEQTVTVLRQRISWPYNWRRLSQTSTQRSRHSLSLAPLDEGPGSFHDQCAPSLLLLLFTGPALYSSRCSDCTGLQPNTLATKKWRPRETPATSTWNMKHLGNGPTSH